MASTWRGQLEDLLVDGLEGDHSGVPRRSADGRGVGRRRPPEGRTQHVEAARGRGSLLLWLRKPALEDSKAMALGGDLVSLARLHDG